MAKYFKTEPNRHGRVTISTDVRPEVAQRLNERAVIEGKNSFAVLREVAEDATKEK